MDVSLYRFNQTLPPLSKTGVIKHEIRAAVIKVMGAIKEEKEASLPLHAQCSMKGKHCFK